MIGAESVSHQNLVRASAACMSCNEWAFLDEEKPIVHSRMCAFPKGEKVKYTMGGSQSRATNPPPNCATQWEAARFPYV